MNLSAVIAQQLNLEELRVAKAIELMNEGGTVPFIARYRKDQTQGLDEIELRDIQHRLEYLRELEERKATVLKSIEEQGKLNDELKQQIADCVDKTLLEDIYAPYRPKRRTRATIAKELGLEPLARTIMAQEETSNTLEEIGRIYLNAEKGLADPTEAVNKALDILAEELSENAEYRQYLRTKMEKEAVMVSKVRKEFAEQKTKFDNYYDFSEFALSMPSHRVLAIRRGEKEKVLRISIEVEDETYISYLVKQVVKSEGVWKESLEKMCADAWTRLLRPSLETEIRLQQKNKAEEEAFGVFAKNLSDILLAAPAGHKSVLALDPGFRSGCKVAVLDKNGQFLAHDIIYPHEPQKKVTEANAKIQELVEKHKIEMIAIGNGTASRETDAFVANLMPKFEHKPIKVIVNEAGASVYSASMVAIEEFPKEDVTTRGAISIGRRLQDPLAELVKVDAKAIGVGQYQHDVNQRELQKRLDEVVESCVNMVGVDLNSASDSLLSYVAGISKNVAKNIVKERNEKGGFKAREDLNKIKGLGPKAFEQAAGFLRIVDAENPLDGSAVHPENYPLVEKIAQELSVEVKELIGNSELLKQVSAEKFVSDEVGTHTITDILAELEKPNRDPRKEFTYARFNEKIQSINDLITGSWLEGVVTNVTNFGAFVDIGVDQDGLIHISEISQKFVEDAKSVLTVGDVVKVRVLAVDSIQKRISLSMREEQAEQRRGRGGPRGKRRRGGRKQSGAGTQGFATIADLKAKFSGKNVSNKPKKKPQPVKLKVSVKDIMRSGR